MTTIRKRKIGNTEFYYLEHSMKVNGKVEKKEKYLGKQVPKNIDEIKKQFMNEIYQEKWYKKLDKIKNNFTKYFHAMLKVIEFCVSNLSFSYGCHIYLL